MVGFFRRFIKNFAQIAEPLTRLTANNVEFQWKEEQQAAFEILAGAICSTPILTFPDYEKPFHIFVDASQVAQGAALMQLADGTRSNYQPIAYMSRTYSTAQRKWPAVQGELNGIIMALRYFKHYIYGNPVIIHTDHKPLVYLLKKKEHHLNLTRWSIELMQYDNLQIEHVDGKRNTVADALSRIAERLSDNDVKDLEESDDIFEVPYCMVTTQDNKLKDIIPSKNNSISQPSSLSNNPLNATFTDKLDKFVEVDLSMEQRNDPELTLAFNYFEKGIIPDDQEKQKILKWYTTHSKLKDNILIHNESEEDDYVLKIVTPIKFRREVFEQFHKKQGHMSLAKTLRAMKNYFWRNKLSDVKNWYNSCHECQLRKPKRTRIPLTLVKNTATLGKVGLDLCGPFPTTKNGNKYILNIVDWFTKYVVSIPIPDSKALTTAKALVNNFILVYGTPVELISDNAKTFTAESFKELNLLLKINKIYTTPYHSAGNGATERTFRTFQDILSKFRVSTQQEFDELLPAATFAYNTTVHDTTGFSPFVLMFGREPLVTIDLFLQPNLKKNYYQDADTKEYKVNLTKNLALIKELAAQKSEQQALNFKRSYDKKATPCDIEEGDLVLLRNYTHKVGESFKLEQLWKGPYKVQKIHFPNATLLNPEKPNGKLKKVHLDQIKRYHLEQPTPEVSDEEYVTEEDESIVFRDTKDEGK